MPSGGNLARPWLAKRWFDTVTSAVALLFLAPVLAIVAILVRMDSPGPSLFRQKRVGRNGVLFDILKFRTMCNDAPGNGREITAGHDPRITRLGRCLRQTKIDELPQLVNVVKGEMSLVGPRPEVPTYMAMYALDQQALILSVRPGITDFAAIEFRDEESILAQADDPHTAYVEDIMPRKFALYQQYVENWSFGSDILIIFKTLRRVGSRSSADHKGYA